MKALNLNLTSTSSFINLLNKQSEYEASYSLSGFRIFLSEALAELDNSDYVEEFEKYVESFKALVDVKHVDYHVDLMTSKPLTEMAITKAIKIIVEECVLNHSYLEHRILGYKLGQKLCPKKVTINRAFKGASVATKLSYGCNLVQFFKHKGLLISKVFKGTNQHTHNCIELSPKFIDFLRTKGVYDRSVTIRTGSANYYVQSHSDEDTGGYSLSRKLMLNTNGFNKTVFQPDSVCGAVNKIQSVPYNLVNDDRLEGILSEYKSADKFYDENGVFMTKEWNKLISDISRFRGETFYFTYAMDDVGRMYDGGNYLTVQGDKFQKAMLEIAGEEIVRVDAKNQSIKLYKILGGDKTLDNDVREELAQYLNVGTNRTSFTRKNVKYPVMVACYGAMQKQVLGQTKEIGCEFRDLFPEDMTDDDKYNLFYNGLLQVAPGVIKLMNLIYKFNDENKTFYNFTMPDGMKVEMTTTEVVTHKGYYVDLISKSTRSVSIEAKVELNNKFNRMLAPRIIQAVDAYVAREVVRRCDFHISLIHDSFGVTAGNVDELIKVYAEVCADVFEMNLLENILGQLDPTLFFRIKKGGLTREDILTASLMEVE